MNKIKISTADNQYHGLGYNSYNFCKNVIPKISTYLLSEYNEISDKTFEELDKVADKLKKIVNIINE